MVRVGICIRNGFCKFSNIQGNVPHEAALTREVDGVGHCDSGAKAEHSVKRQDILDAILTDNHHYVVLSNSVSGQSARHSPDGVACLRKCERLTRKTIDLPQHITQHVLKTPTALTFTRPYLRDLRPST